MYCAWHDVCMMCPQADTCTPAQPSASDRAGERAADLRGRGLMWGQVQPSSEAQELAVLAGSERASAFDGMLHIWAWACRHIA